jgi:type I restriction enzyme R subunit
MIYPDAVKEEFLHLADRVDKLHRAAMPDPGVSEFASDIVFLAAVREELRPSVRAADISGVLSQVEAFLDRSVAADAYAMPPQRNLEELVDLSRIDFYKLQAFFTKAEHKRIAVDAVRAAAVQKAEELILRNRTRRNLSEELQRLIADYNSGARTAETFFQDLIQFLHKLEEEQQRPAREGLSEEEQAICDLLLQGGPQLDAEANATVKQIACEVLKKVRPKLVIDWRKRHSARAAIQSIIGEVLDALPKAFSNEKYDQKCAEVYDHIYESYFGEGESIYARKNNHVAG